MANRVRLRWNRSQDEETKYYRVFRSEKPNITHNKNLNDIVMKVEHPKEVNVLRVYDEEPVMISSNTFQLRYDNIVLKNKDKEFAFVVHVDDAITYDYTLDRELGRIIFDYDLPPNANVIVKNYAFDGVEAWDYGIEELGKSYYGPEAKDTSAPFAPANLSIEKDLSRNRVVLRWSSSAKGGKMFYYKVDAAIDERRYSRLSKIEGALLSEPLSDRPYHIERSEDGIRWIEVAKVKANEFYEYMVDRQPPSPVRNVAANIYTYKGMGMAQVQITWSPVVDTSASSSAMYRVRATNRIGMVSEPSQTVGPIDFKVSLDHILIRRKRNDGLLPSYDGTDAVTVARIKNLDETKFFEEVEDNRDYMYGIWIVDEAGNYSTLTYTTIFVPDATAPNITANLVGEEFHTIGG